jgi:tetraacyldisaccharide 4'-kinase
MIRQQNKIQRWLYPISWIYGIGVCFRNKLFDWGHLQSKSFGIPVICIGNLAVGGTGKTPHTEYLIRLLLQERKNIAVLSRGYKRATKGYQLATNESSAQSIGDEPRQIKDKYPNICVAVDENRCHGIEQLMQLHHPAVDVIILDDAFQHRYVKAGLNILLTDYHRLFTEDTLLPAGRLREPAQGKNRAHIVIVTKCPNDIKPIDFNIVAKKLDLYPFQQLYFSKLKYGELTPLFSGINIKKRPISSLRRDDQVLLVTGIASPTALTEKLKEYTRNIALLTFDDHHNFNNRDIRQIEEHFKKMKGERKLIITTEKDAVRLRHHPALSDALKTHFFYIPIEITILQDQQEIFNQNIIDYVRANSRNRSLPEK